MKIDDFVKTHDNFILKLPLFGQETSKTTALHFIHTPGHTPGSQCIILNQNSLFAGDTLFIGTCGRLDLPGSNVEHMWESLLKLKSLPDFISVYPGHSYNGRVTTILQEKKAGVLKFQDKERFYAIFSGNAVKA